LPQDSEKFGQVVSIVQVRIELSDGVQNLNEDAHNVGEDGDTKQEDDGTDDPFGVSPGVVVTESHRAQRRDGKIGHQNGVCNLALVFNSKGNEEEILVEFGVSRIHIVDEILDKFTEH
jgi:hypothetical protein